MKDFFALCCFLAVALLFPVLSAGEWHTDISKAKAESRKTGRPIFILFTDASAACRRLDIAIFSQKKFMDYADKNLVLMKVDFSPAINRQTKALTAQNSKLKKDYGVNVFPTAFLLDGNGKLSDEYNFVKKDGGMEKHRRKLNEILEFDPPKRYAEYVDGFVKKYVPPAPELDPEEVAQAKKPAAKPEKKPAKKPDKKPVEKTDESTEEIAISGDNSGRPLIPLDPEGDFQNWLKASLAEEATEEAKEIEEVKEIVEEEKEAVEAKNNAEKKDEAKAVGSAPVPK